MSDSSVKVAVRVRPFNGREKQESAELCISMSGTSTTIFNKSTNFSRAFIFDYSYWSHDQFIEDPETGQFIKSDPSSKYADQAIVFNDIGNGVLNNAWQGYHCCLFAYGQTGSGKSYSMVGYGQNIGIIPITCETIFQQISDRENPNIEYKVSASMLEIYNEQVQDLLVPPQNRVQGGLKVREDPKNGVFVENLTQQPCMCYEEIAGLLEIGNKHRTVAATNMNATSSRAHTVLTISFTQIFYEEHTGKPLNRKQSNINLVDLAGSERAGKTGATGERLQEGSSINKSLSTLGKVITTLAKKSSGQLGKNEVIPYRESKLTRILQNALGGNSKTTMIAAISPAIFNFEESLSTLRYADAVKSIKNQAIVNETPQERLIRELKEENEKLKAMLEKKLQGSNEGMNEEAKIAYEKEIEALRRARDEIDKNWQQKLRSHGVRVSVLPLINHQVQKVNQGPYLSNLNEDPLLSGYLKYNFRPGLNRLGRKNQLNPPDMIIEGLGIGIDHCCVVFENEECKLLPSQDLNIKTMRNGKIIESPVVLEHQDRIRFGNHNFFLFIDPEELSNEHYDWEYAVKESNEEQIRGILGENNEELLKKEQEMRLKIEKEWDEAKKKMEEEKEQLQRQLKDKGDTGSSLAEKEKELLLRHQAIENDIIYKQKMLQQHEDNRLALQRLTQILSHSIQQINEANERAVLLGKNVCFQPELYREGSKLGLGSTNVRVKVLYSGVDEDFPINWPVAKLEERLVDMREICNQLSYGLEIQDIDLGYDPFNDQIDNSQSTHQLIGNCYVYLEILFYVLGVDEDLIPIIDDHGKNQGSLRLSISPLISGQFEDYDSLREIIGRNIEIQLNIVEALGIPENLCNKVYCEYSLVNTSPFRTDISQGNTTCPKFNYSHTHNFLITDDFIENIISHALTISVYGDITEEKRNQGISKLRDHAIHNSLKMIRSFINTDQNEELGSINELKPGSIYEEISPMHLNYSIHKEMISMNNSVSMVATDMRSIIRAQREEILRLRKQFKDTEKELIEKSISIPKNIATVENVREKSCACLMF